MIVIRSLCRFSCTGFTFLFPNIKSDKEDIKREIQIMQYLGGQPNIVEFKGAYEDNWISNMFMWLWSFVGVMHRDLKPDNLLLSSNDDKSPLKATNFGLSVFLEEASETLKSINSKILEMCYFVIKMILEGYGLPQHYILNFRDMNRTCDSRLTRYECPENYSDSEIGMRPHTDKSAITILYQNDVQGLQVLNKAGKWIDVQIPSNGFAVIIGDVLKVWSNGRLEASKHRVVIRGGKVRYSFVFFVVPDEDMVIKVPSELVDEDNMYPLRYRPFKYGEYLQYRDRVPRDTDILETFAGV